MRIQARVIDNGLCPRRSLLVHIGMWGFPTEVCVIGSLSNDGQLVPNPVKEGLPTNRKLLYLWI